MLPLLHLLLLTTSPFPLLPSTDPTQSRPSTIPASREQPGSADSCPLNLPDDFFRGVSAACSQAAAGDICCPALSAWLLAAYSAEALATRVQPSASRSYDELPVLPGDTEPCAAAVEAALKARGVEIKGANDTCGAASCTCRVGLHPLQCSGPFVVGGGEGRWVPTYDVAESLEVGCERPGLGGCSRCLKVLYELKSKDSEVGGINGEYVKGGRECQLMGLTWLLSKNRTRYLPTATYVLRAFREAAGGGGGYPATCSVAGDGAEDMPLPVGSDELLGTATSAAAGEWPPRTYPIFFFLLVISFFFNSKYKVNKNT